jgi:hypothetical protein
MSDVMFRKFFIGIDFASDDLKQKYKSTKNEVDYVKKTREMLNQDKNDRFLIELCFIIGFPLEEKEHLEILEENLKRL